MLVYSVFGCTVPENTTVVRRDYFSTWSSLDLATAALASLVGPVDNKGQPTLQVDSRDLCKLGDEYHINKAAFRNAGVIVEAPLDEVV